MQNKLIQFAWPVAWLILQSSMAQAQVPAPPQVPQVKGAKPAQNLIEPNSAQGAPGASAASAGNAAAGKPNPGSNAGANPLTGAATNANPNSNAGAGAGANGAPPATAAGGANTGGSSLQTDAISESLFAGLMDPFEYDPRGRKDPFVQPIPEKALAPGNLHGPILPLQAYNLEQLRLVGIIWDVRHPKAMIKDPDGKTHIVGPNTKLGPKNGYIAVIREGEMVVVETTEQMGKLVSTAQVVKIAK